MTTLKDVASAVGVSVATVSYVLTGRGSVSKETSVKVMAAVKQLGYRPNRTAQAMRTGFTQSIGLLLPDLTNPFFPQLAQKIENAARQRDFSVLLVDCQSNSDTEAEAFNLLKQQGVDGIIWCPASDTAPDSIHSVGCPVVLIDRPISGFDSVYSDYYKGGRLLGEYALSMGHTQVGLLSGPRHIEGARKRRQGFIDAVTGPDKELTIVWELEVPFNTELTPESLQRLSEKDVTLVVAADDLIAVGTISALNEIGLRVPEDVSVTGFDNIPWSTVVTPKLTTINQAISAMGGQAVDILAEKISDPNIPIRTVLLDVELIERNSVRRVKA